MTDSNEPEPVRNDPEAVFDHILKIQRLTQSAKEHFWIAKEQIKQSAEAVEAAQKALGELPEELRYHYGIELAYDEEGHTIPEWLNYLDECTGMWQGFIERM
jgi:hypothetical protein